VDLLLAAVFALFGLVVGSFLNVVIHRVPAGVSIVAPPSACPSCGVEIKNRDNIPVLSYLLLRGRCRSCGASISIRYPLVEAANAALWAAAALRFEVIEQAIFVAVTLSVLLALAAIDLDVRRLPNAIVLPSTAAAIVWVAAASAVDGAWGVLRTSLLCGAAAFTLFFLIALVSGGMGMGDVKLAAFIGVVTGRFGWEVTVAAVFAAFLVGGGLGIVLLVAGKGRKAKMPFGPAMAIGAVVALFAGTGPVRAWLGL
jgi:leader peptidase (prepilin peptidase)/N-methyltransferase